MAFAFHARRTNLLGNLTLDLLRRAEREEREGWRGAFYSGLQNDGKVALFGIEICTRYV